MAIVVTTGDDARAAELLYGVSAAELAQVLVPPRPGIGVGPQSAVLVQSRADLGRVGRTVGRRFGQTL